MEAFLDNGHLSPDALLALASGQDALSQLQRLEAAEHLAFCDACLLHYSACLSNAHLAAPQHPALPRLQRSLRARALSRFAQQASRCTAAIVAVSLSLTILWGGQHSPPQPSPDPSRPSISHQLTGLTQNLNASLSSAVSLWSDFFDTLRPSQFTQGGNFP